jgi:hypothetical protein
VPSNRTADRFRTSTPPRELIEASFLEGELSARRGGYLAELIYRGWRNWPGNERQRAALIGYAVAGFIAALVSEED